MILLQNRLARLLVSFTFVMIAGCERTEQIAHYTVPKPVPFEAPPGDESPPHTQQSAGEQQPAGEPKDRTLGAIVLSGERGWFFKLTGPKDVVAAKADEFTTFLKSLQFATPDNPKWTLPAGWREQPGSGMRYATLLIPSDGKPLELTVIPLPKTPGDEQGYLLSNINRWRGQMKLPPITSEQLATESTQIQLDGTTATMVNLLGTAAPNTMGGPFSSGAGNGK